MYLKEAFRYQNFLDGIMRQMSGYLQNSANVVKTTTQHFRSKANPEAEDEIVDSSSERRIAVPINVLVKFFRHIAAEKETLTYAISKAKRTCGIDIDAEIANNRTRQELSRVLNTMGSIRPTERMSLGRAFKFNAEGNQVQYTYDIKEVSVIDFDRSVVKSVSKRMLSDADNMSSAIDKLLVETIVDYEPKYDVNDSFDDVLETFVESNR